MYKQDDDKPQAVMELVKAYDLLVKGIDDKAHIEVERAYGGIIRAGKGILVESIAKHLVEIAWKDLGGKQDRLSLDRQAIKVPLKKEYLERVKSPEVREYIKKNLPKYYYRLMTDVHVHFNNKLVLVIECKAYTENAMIKRILVDFTLFNEMIPKLDFILFQLESQLGGDYGKVAKTIYGSESTHTLLSYFDIDLNIITLLEGERKVDMPIHKKEFYKPLKVESVMNAVEAIKSLLHKHL